MRIPLLTSVLLFATPLATAQPQPTTQSTAPSEIVPAGATAEKVAGNMNFTEGPAWITDHLIFSDIPANELKRWSEKDGVSTFRSPSENTNGNTVDREGRLISCQHTARRVIRTEPDGSITVLADQYQGKKLNSPNDAVVKSDGTIYFTDPTYGIDRKLKEQPHNHVFRLNPETKELTAVATDFDQPNGLCFSPDEKRLYVADSGRPHHVRAFDVQPDGTLAHSRVFCTITPGAPDGIRADAQGNLYSTAGNGVQVFSPDAQPLALIPTPESPANCAFGGPDFQTLFMTARTSLYRIHLNVKGATRPQQD
jgi:gluconolactonase